MWSMFLSSLFQFTGAMAVFLLLLPLGVMVLVTLLQCGSDLLHFFWSYHNRGAV